MESIFLGKVVVHLGMIEFIAGEGANEGNYFRILDGIFEKLIRHNIGLIAEDLMIGRVSTLKFNVFISILFS